MEDSEEDNGTDETSSTSAQLCFGNGQFVKRTFRYADISVSGHSGKWTFW